MEVSGADTSCPGEQTPCGRRPSDLGSRMVAVPSLSQGTQSAASEFLGRGVFSCRPWPLRAPGCEVTLNDPDFLPLTLLKA